nr:response regulator transcription factor [Pseudarthrobacter sp. NS4]
MTENAPITVLLVDDQPLLRMGFRLILEGEEDLRIVGEASDGAEAVRLVNDLSPDVVLMDVRMPVLDGIETTRAITAAGSCARIIILTTFDVDEYAFAGLQAGASAFLLKDAAPSDLIHAVRVVASGDAVVAPRITQRLLETYVRGAAKPVPAPPVPDPLLADLTPRETEMLEAMAEGLSNAGSPPVLPVRGHRKDARPPDPDQAPPPRPGTGSGVCLRDGPGGSEQPGLLSCTGVTDLGKAGRGGL